MAGDPDFCETCLTRNLRKKTVKCYGCERKHHRSCVGLTARQADGIPNWSCPDCLGSVGIPTHPRTDQDIDLVEYISQCRTRSRVLRIIPKGAAICVADALQKLLDGVIQDKYVLAWGKLLSFESIGIRQPLPDAESDGHGVSLTTRVKRQVVAFMSDDSLHVPEGSVLVREQSKDARLGRSVAGKVADGDIRGAVRLLASTEDVAPQNATTEAPSCTG